MNFRQMIGLSMLSIGVVLTIYGLHEFGYIPRRDASMKEITDSPVSPTERIPESIAVVEDSDRFHPLIFTFVGGGLIVLGIGVSFYHRE